MGWAELLDLFETRWVHFSQNAIIDIVTQRGFELCGEADLSLSLSFSLSSALDVALGLGLKNKSSSSFFFGL